MILRGGHGLRKGGSLLPIPRPCIPVLHHRIDEIEKKEYRANLCLNNCVSKSVFDKDNSGSVDSQQLTTCGDSILYFHCWGLKQEASLMTKSPYHWLNQQHSGVSGVSQTARTKGISNGTFKTLDLYPLLLVIPTSTV